MELKPKYQVPTMAEINKLPWNGKTVISTFSGGGGSSTGYKMAGYKVLLASEFIPAAQDTYRANHPSTILDTRDIRLVTAENILDQTGLKVGELDLFDGSPPCSAFSTSGIREKGWGKSKSYSDSTQVVDDLFFEYARLVKGLQPKIFVAENVSGLVKGTAKGYFLEILQALKDCGYQVKAKLLNASWLGVPQSRERLIFIGVRNDLGLQPVFPKPLVYQYSVHDSLADVSVGEYKKLGGDLGSFWRLQKIGESRFDAGKRLGVKKGGHLKIRVNPNKPCGTIDTVPDNKYHWNEPRTLSINELKRICGFPDDYILTGTYNQQYERLGRAVPPVMMAKVAQTIYEELLDGKF